jgi:hypothetical protein
MIKIGVSHMLFTSALKFFMFINEELWKASSVRANTKKPYWWQCKCCLIAVAGKTYTMFVKL